MIIFIIILSGLAVLVLFSIVMFIQYIIAQFIKYRNRNRKKSFPNNLNKEKVKKHNKAIIPMRFCELCGTPNEKGFSECSYCKNKI